MSGFLSYFEICDLIRKKKWKTEFNDTYKSLYAYKRDQWVTYDDPKSLNFKVIFIESNFFHRNYIDDDKKLKVL